MSQVIDLTVASQNPYPASYPLDKWTPENWYKEMLNIPLVDEADRTTIHYNLRIMRGWRFNLIPFFIFGFALAVLVVLENLRFRKNKTYQNGATEHKTGA